MRRLVSVFSFLIVAHLVIGIGKSSAQSLYLNVPSSVDPYSPATIYADSDWNGVPDCGYYEDEFIDCQADEVDVFVWAADGDEFDDADWGVSQSGGTSWTSQFVDNFVQTDDVTYEGEVDVYWYNWSWEIEMFQPGYAFQQIMRVNFPRIDGTCHDLWYFNGESPSGYDLSCSLTSSYGPETTWSVTSGSDKVSLSTTSGQTTIVTAVSGHPSTGHGDISITASTSSGYPSVPWSITSRTPASTTPVPSRNVHVCGAPFTFGGSYWGYGYQDNISYDIFDSVLDPMPSQVPIGETFTSDYLPFPPPSPQQVSDAWLRPHPLPPSAQATTTPANQPARFDDHIVWGWSDWDANGQPNVSPVFSCNNVVSVARAEQEWHVGSLSIGAGALIQKDWIERWTGKGAHTTR